MSLADAAAREKALDVYESFCVSAPAGSGKTGLLVKRFLLLLSRVPEPERVVAITFTRKAAAEMRARVVGALRTAADSTAENTPADNAHQAELFAIAAKVRAHDQKHGWGLMANPARLRIQTIDSFCGYLTRQMPVLSGCGGQVSAADDSRPFYREAIDRFLRRELAHRGAAEKADITTLLLHLDNNWETAVSLLSRLLQRREQWQPVFGGGGLGDEAQQSLADITAELVDYRIDLLRQRLGATLPELDNLLSYRQEVLGYTSALTLDSDDIRAWQSLAGMLLKADGDWRKTVNKNDGFPTGEAEAKARKQEMIALLKLFREEADPALLMDLRQVPLLPDTREQPEHWNVLAALTRLLPRLGAELLVVFQQRGEVDHAQIAMAALMALGEDTAPTDTALRLDHVIEHLLVDEFQDTSSVQFELIRRLTRGWSEHNAQNAEAPRTLMLVGDAMQSIYGFREANVGLFIRARSEGVGDLNLVPLYLTVNFRSQAALVQWSNEQFVAAFPAVDDAQLGAVRFRAADAARPMRSAPDIALFSGEGAANAEIQALCDQLAIGVASDAVKSIAILGRSRNQLRPVLAALRERGIEAAARDLDTLAQRPLIRDLVTLCKVLSDRFDRFAWLSLLRCPAIALDNADLLWVARYAPTAADFLENDFVDASPTDSLSPIAQERMRQVEAMLRFADHYRDRLALRVWVEECWLRLQGAASLANDVDVRDAEQFFQCIEQLEQTQQSLNAAVLDETMDGLYAASGDERCKVQVMTLHKAKGLEFDWVFIPALGKGTASQDRELLLWDEFALPDSPPAFLLDIRANVAEEKAPRLYDYLKAQAKQKRLYEATRLFYVGCTRAADYLWLGGSLAWDDDRDKPRSPASGSLLHVIWPSIKDSVAVTLVDQKVSETLVSMQDTPPHHATGYQRLAALPRLEMLPPDSPGEGGVIADNRLARAFGTAVHRCLESLVYRPSLPRDCDATLRQLLEVALLEAGADSVSLKNLLETGTATLTRVLRDPWIQWGLSSQRSDRAAEVPLTSVKRANEQSSQANLVQQLILDYVFVDEVRGERWVVDYKTSEPLEDQTDQAFIESQLQSYSGQLSAYADVLSRRFAEPVRCALYFTALGRHAEWDAPPVEDTA